MLEESIAVSVVNIYKSYPKISHIIFFVNLKIVLGHIKEQYWNLVALLLQQVFDLTL